MGAKTNNLRDKIGSHRKFSTIVVVVLLIALSYIYRAHTHSSLSDNLYAGSIEVAVTVLLIDTILDFDRRHRLNVINLQSSQSLRLAIATSILQILSQMGLKVENGLEMVNESTDKLSQVRQNYLNSAEYNSHINTLSNMNPATKKSLDKLVKILDSSSKMLEKGLKDVRPYANPHMTQLSSDARVESLVMGTLIDEFYTKLPDALTEKHKPGSKEYKDAIQASSILWSSILKGKLGSSTSDGLLEHINNVLEVYITIHRAASANQLYIDA